MTRAMWITDDGGTFRPIATPFAGRLFRSRLEARWAVFYTVLGIPWIYEPQGFAFDELPSGEGNSRFDDGGSSLAYLPDFYLPDHGCYVEIKALAPNADAARKAALLARHTGARVFVFFGQPGYHTDGGYPFGQRREDGAYVYFADGGADNYQTWCVCPTCGRFDIQYDGRSARIPCGHAAAGENKAYTYDDPRLLAAYDRANRARFTRESC